MVHKKNARAQKNNIKRLFQRIQNKLHTNDNNSNTISSVTSNAWNKKSILKQLTINKIHNINANATNSICHRLQTSNNPKQTKFNNFRSRTSISTSIRFVQHEHDDRRINWNVSTEEEYS